MSFNTTKMFHQFIGDGANVFIAIAACLIGFGVALGYTDFIKVSRKQGKKGD